MSAYSSVTVSGYNDTPPSDDGSQTSANEVTWAKHKTKIGDPLKTAIESINTNLTNLDTFTSLNATTLTLSGAVDEKEGSAVASATTADIWSSGGNTVHVTGTTTITSLGTAPQAGAKRMVIFDGALTLTHGANLNLPGGENITTAAGDSMEVYADTTTQLDVVRYTKASGKAVVETTTTTVTSSTAQATTSGTSKTFTAPSTGIKRVSVQFSGVSTDGSGVIGLRVGDSTGIYTSGYLGVSTFLATSSLATTGRSTYFGASDAVTAPQILHGIAVFELLDPSTNTWSYSARIARSDSTAQTVSAGSITLSSELTDVQVMNSAGDTFDAGKLGAIWTY